jgi:hypothetical protein
MMPEDRLMLHIQAQQQAIVVWAVIFITFKISTATMTILFIGESAAHQAGQRD